MGNKEMKTVRQHFADLVKENGYSPEDLKKFRDIRALVVDAVKMRASDCPISTDKCLAQDCGYDEGGCGNDECCNNCDSCMLMWDTCSNKECAPLG